MPENILKSLNQVIGKHDEAGELNFDLRLGLKHK